MLCDARICGCPSNCLFQPRRQAGRLLVSEQHVSKPCRERVPAPNRSWIENCPEEPCIRTQGNPWSHCGANWAILESSPLEGRITFVLWRLHIQPRVFPGSPRQTHQHVAQVVNITATAIEQRRQTLGHHVFLDIKPVENCVQQASWPQWPPPRHVHICCCSEFRLRSGTID